MLKELKKILRMIEEVEEEDIEEKKKKKILVSKEGYDEYYNELEKLKKSLTRNASCGSDAYTSAVGDGWHDNFDFEQTMREEKQITYNIKKMMNDTKYLEIVKKHNKKDYVDLDDTVSIKFIYDDTDEIEEYKLTGKYISNNNEITLNSPLGNAIYNKKIGSTIIYKVNNKEIKVQIIKKII